MANDDPQDEAEALDDDRLPSEYPPDAPFGVEDYGTTGGEERIPEPLDERVRREEPDPVVQADAAIAEGTGLGRMPTMPDGEDDLHLDGISSGDMTLRDVATEREAPAPAEIDAVHVTHELR